MSHSLDRCKKWVVNDCSNHSKIFFRIMSSMIFVRTGNVGKEMEDYVSLGIYGCTFLSFRELKMSDLTFEEFPALHRISIFIDP